MCFLVQTCMISNTPLIYIISLIKLKNFVKTWVINYMWLSVSRTVFITLKMQNMQKHAYVPKI